MMILEPVTPDRLTKSELLTSGLNCNVMAEQVLGFLDRGSVLQCLEVAELCERFDIKDHYCTLHGTKLESQVAHRRFLKKLVRNEDNDQGDNENLEENEANMDVDDKGGKEEKTAKKDETNEVKIECVDCVEAEFYRDRCNVCDRFEPVDGLIQCGNCSYQECGPFLWSCHGSMGFCRSCLQHVCARPGCKQWEYCDCCFEPLCEGCEDFMFCEGCARQRCTDCFYENGMCCDKCSAELCDDCEYQRPCEVCGQELCSRCTRTFYCEVGKHGVCEDCSELVECDACDEEHGCLECCYQGCFRCGACHGVYCREECKDYISCEICCEEFCTSCDKGWFCHACQEYHCSAHAELSRFQGCGKGSQDKKFQCAECQTMSCCSKVYSCSECAKEICAGCHDFFGICSCGKGKFSLKKHN
eukprot:Sro307_g113400.1 n/a (415) ;mRNA; r:58822-60066